MLRRKDAKMCLILHLKGIQLTEVNHYHIEIQSEVLFISTIMMEISGRTGECWE